MPEHELLRRIDPEKLELLEDRQFHFDPANLTWARRSLGRHWSVSYEEVRENDVDWLHNRLAVFPTEPLDPRNRSGRY